MEWKVRAKHALPELFALRQQFKNLPLQVEEYVPSQHNRLDELLACLPGVVPDEESAAHGCRIVGRANDGV